VYWSERDLVSGCELVVLRGLCFDVEVDLPFRYLLTFLDEMQGSRLILCATVSIVLHFGAYLVFPIERSLSTCQRCECSQPRGVSSCLQRLLRCVRAANRLSAALLILCTFFCPRISLLLLVQLARFSLPPTTATHVLARRAGFAL
jgi:hypothetical protein